MSRLTKKIRKAILSQGGRPRRVGKRIEYEPQCRYRRAWKRLRERRKKD